MLLNVVKYRTDASARRICCCLAGLLSATSEHLAHALLLDANETAQYMNTMNVSDAEKVSRAACHGESRLATQSSAKLSPNRIPGSRTNARGIDRHC